MTNLGTAFKFLSLIGSFATIGALLAMAFLLLDLDGRLSAQALKLRRLLWSSALIWAAGTIGTIVITLATIFEQSISASLDPTLLRSFVMQITLGQYLLFQVIAALVVAAFAFRIRTVLTTALLLVFSLIGLVVPVFQSHEASSGSHGLAVGALVVHVAAVALWVGGVIAITFLKPEDRSVAIPRFSELALWSVVAVVASGTLNSWARLDFQGAWNSAYAYVVIAKIFLTLGLVAIGYFHRMHLAKLESIDWLGVTRLIFIEVFIMLSTVAMGAWLSSNEPPVRPSTSDFDASIALTGITTPPPPTWNRIFFSYEPNVLMIGILVTAVSLYVKGVLVLTRRGDTWPVGRTVAFGLGIAGIDFATSGGLGLYANFAFSYHMVAHMVLGMIAPIAIVLGAPITLALRTLPQGRNKTERGVRGTALAALHSKIAAFYTNPVVALMIFDGSLFALYFTDLFGSMMQSQIGHLVMNFHFILSGLLFFHVIIGIDPNPRRIPHLVRIVIVFAAMSIHAFFSVALMSSSTLIDRGYFASLKTPWLNDFLADQKLAGSIGWAMGEIPILLALVATFISWLKDDSRETKRIEKNTERAALTGQPDELAEYNEYLQKLAERDRNNN